VHGVALNITVESYDKQMDFGLVADAHAMPDVRNLAKAIEIAFEDLRLLITPAAEDGEDDALADAVLAAAKRGVGAGVAGMGRVARQAVQRVARTAVETVVDTAVKQASRAVKLGTASRKSAHASVKRTRRA
jgi:hypothetical protein